MAKIITLAQAVGGRITSFLPEAVEGSITENNCMARVAERQAKEIRQALDAEEAKAEARLFSAADKARLAIEKREAKEARVVRLVAQVDPSAERISNLVRVLASAGTTDERIIAFGTSLFTWHALLVAASTAEKDPGWTKALEDFRESFESIALQIEQAAKAEKAKRVKSIKRDATGAWVYHYDDGPAP